MLTSQAIDLFIHSRSARNDAASTLKWYRIILEYFEALYPGELPTNPEAIDIFLTTCKGGDERRHGFYRTLRAFYRFLEKRYQIPNPVKLIDPPRRKRKLPRPLLPADLAKLLAYNHEHRITAYILFLTDTGARISELDALMPEHILKMPWGPVARLTVNGKTGERYVPLMDSTATTIIPFLPVPWKTETLERHISRAFRDCGVVGSAHNLRHTFGTMWNGSEFALKDILGHSNFEMLSKYRAFRLETIGKLHKIHSPLALLQNMSEDG